jgi:hypothetical protein
MTEYKYGELCVVIDNTDADFIEKFEQASEEYNDSVKVFPKTGKKSEQIQYLIDAVDKAFIRLFGKEAPVLMFGESRSSQQRTDAFIKLIEIMSCDTSATDNLDNAIAKIGRNRAERRYANKHNNHNKRRKKK